MSIEEYNNLCLRLGKYCTMAKENPTMKRTDTLEHDFRRCYYEEQEWGELSGSSSKVEAVAIPGYRKTLSIFEDLKAFLEDLKAGAVNCPEGLRAQLVWRLNDIYGYCSELSGLCMAEFDKIAPRGPQTVPEMIEAKADALRLAKAFQDAGYIGEDYKPREGLTTAEMALIGRELGKKCGHGWIAKVAKFWSIKGKEPGKALCREADRGEIKHGDTKVNKVLQIIADCER